MGWTPLGLDGASPCWHPPLGTTSGRDAGTRRSPTGLGRWPCCYAAGCPSVSWSLVGDNGYTVLDLLHCCQSLREPVTLIARLRLDAGLYAPAPLRQPGQNGRPPLKGPRRPSLKALLDQDYVAWTVAPVSWYDGTTRIVELTSQTAVWYRSGKPAVTIRWVLIRDPQGIFAPQALLCTDPSADPTQILQWFVLRWQLEVTFQEARTHLGMETQRQWSDLAIARTTPVLLDRFSWTTVAAQALQEHHPHHPAHRRLVRQTDADFRRSHRLPAKPTVAGVGGFLTVGRRPRRTGTPSRSVPSTCRFPCLRRLKCGKSSQGSPLPGPRPVRPTVHPPLQYRLPPGPDQLIAG